MAHKKRKYQADTQFIENATLVSHHVRGKDLADIQPIGYLSGLESDVLPPSCTRDMVLRLIDRLKKK